MQKRIEWLDLTKVLTMFFVIFDHLVLRNSHVSDWVWLFHLPTFFLISGIFYKQPHSFLIGLKKDTLRLLLPVVIWWVVGMITWQPFFYFYFQLHLSALLFPERFSKMLSAISTAKDIAIFTNTHL